MICSTPGAKSTGSESAMHNGRVGHLHLQFSDGLPSSWRWSISTTSRSLYRVRKLPGSQTILGGPSARRISNVRSLPIVYPSARGAYRTVGFEIMGSYRRGERLSQDIDVVIYHPYEMV